MTGGEFFFKVDWVKLDKQQPGFKFTFSVTPGNTFRYGNTQFTRSQVGFTNEDIIISLGGYYNFTVDIYLRGFKQSTVRMCGLIQATRTSGSCDIQGGYSRYFPGLSEEKGKAIFTDAIELRNLQIDGWPQFKFSDNLYAKLDKMEKGNSQSTQKPVNTTKTTPTPKPSPAPSTKQTASQPAATSKSTSNQSQTSTYEAQRQQALQKNQQSQQESYRKLEESTNNLARGLQVVFGNKVDQEKRQERLNKQAADRRQAASMVGEYYFGHTLVKLREINLVSQVLLKNPTSLSTAIKKSLSETTTFKKNIFSDPNTTKEILFETDLSFDAWSRPSDDRLGTNNFIMKKQGSYCLSDMILLLGAKETEIDRIMFNQTYSKFMQNAFIATQNSYAPFLVLIHDYVYNIKDLDKKQNLVLYKIKEKDTADYFNGAADLIRYKFIEKYRSNKNVYETRVKIKGSPDLQPVFPDMNRELGYIDFDKTSFQYEDISKKYTNASSSLLISQGNVIGVSQYVDTSSVSTNRLKEKGWIFFGDALMNKSERTEYNNSTGIMRLYANAWFPGVILVVSEIRKKGGGGMYGMHFDYEPYDPGTYTAEYAELTTFTYDPSIGEYNATFHQILKSMKQSERLAQINLLLYKYPDNLLALHTKYLIEKLMNDEVDANKTKDKIQKLISAK
jgi:hypothetical protein